MERDLRVQRGSRPRVSGMSSDTPGPDEPAGRHSLIVVASRLPASQVLLPDGEVEWQPSPGGW